MCPFLYSDLCDFFDYLVLSSFIHFPIHFDYEKETEKGNYFSADKKIGKKDDREEKKENEKTIYSDFLFPFISVLYPVLSFSEFDKKMDSKKG